VRTFYTRMLSVFWASYAYAEHKHTICMLTVSIRLQIMCVCSANAYDLQAYAQLVQIVHVRLAHAYNYFVQPNNTRTNSTCMLSIRVQFVLVC